MIRFYFHPTPNPAKVAMFLEETGLPYEVVPVDASKGEQHVAAFRAINPTGKAPAIVDTDGPGGTEARIFDSSAILLYLAEKTGRFMGTSQDRGELLSWLFFISSGLGPYSGQSVHFQRSAPEKLPYAINRYRREAERHYAVLDKHLDGREFIVGTDYSIVDMSAWGWVDRAKFVFFGSEAPLRRSRTFPVGSSRSTPGPLPPAPTPSGPATPSRRRATRKPGAPCFRRTTPRTPLRRRAGPCR